MALMARIPQPMLMDFWEGWTLLILAKLFLPDNQLGDPTYADTHLNNFEFPASVELNMLEFRNHWLKNKDLYKTKLHSTNSYPDCPVFEDHDRSPASGKAKEVQSPLPREATHPKLCQNKTSQVDIHWLIILIQNNSMYHLIFYTHQIYNYEWTQLDQRALVVSYFQLPRNRFET